MSNKVKIMRVEHTGNPVCLDRVVIAEKDTETVEYKYSTDGFEIARVPQDRLETEYLGYVDTLRTH